MNLNEWAIKWAIPFEAVEDLRRSMTADVPETNVEDTLSESEAAVQTRIRLEASSKGFRIWRNNVGAYDERFPPSPGTRWGLANETKQMNKLIKSSDLIGIKPVVIQGYHVGQIIGQFIAREVKPSDWRYTATEREQAQLKFLELVIALGGDGQFANSEGTL